MLVPTSVTTWRAPAGAKIQGRQRGRSIRALDARGAGADAIAASARSNAAIEEELERLARENRRIYRAALKYIEAEDSYNEARTGVEPEVLSSYGRPPRGRRRTQRRWVAAPQFAEALRP